MELSETQARVLIYLSGCQRASTRRIYKTTGGTSATVQSLAARGLIEPCLQASYRITAEGCVWAQDLLSGFGETLEAEKKAQ